jgi:hypothetical protein
MQVRFSWDVWKEAKSVEKVKEICKQITSLQTIFHDKFQQMTEEVLSEAYAEMAAGTDEGGIERLEHKVAAKFMRTVADAGLSEETGMCAGWFYSKHWLEKAFAKVEV